MEGLKLTDSIEKLKGVGPRRAALYHKLGIETIYGLLTFYPRDYLDLSNPVPILETVLDENNVVRATIYKKNGEQRIRKGLSLFKAFATDGEHNLTITIFNSKFLFDTLELDQEYYFYGKVTGTLLRREMNSPLFVHVDDPALIRPVYSLTEGLTNKLIQGNVREALDVWGDRLSDCIPYEIRQKYHLCQLRYAMENIHFPEDFAALELAKNRLIFEELLVLQLGLLLLRRKNRMETGVLIKEADLSEFYASLPFELTGGQRQAIDEALADMTGARSKVPHGESRTSTDERPASGPAHGTVRPMNRLVQGDVGSGKTMVAAALCYACHKNGYQATVMAPTQILAEQHYDTFRRQLEPLGVKCCLLTGSQTVKQRTALLEEVRNGGCSVVIGTHALVQSDVEFHALGLVVTDEQHRFGVAQRATLAAKGDNPHLLVMSATPIPRTLALIIYGDLDVSVIREMPKGRLPIDTFAVGSDKRGRALGFVKKHLNQGRQAYIVCPLIDENESELISTRQYIEALRKTPLAQYRVEALNGRMKPKEKETLMAAFKRGEVQVLVSTTVVEVGVDVPNANIMLIENAERFGLSQLHQLRGRVGRGQYKSFCILISDNMGEDNRKRLKVMTSTSDGFQIAEEDLKLRGPGDFFGVKQHGLPALKIANLIDDMEVLRKTQRVARGILQSDPNLTAGENRGLRIMVKRLYAQNDQATLN